MFEEQPVLLQVDLQTTFQKAKDKFHPSDWNNSLKKHRSHKLEMRKQKWKNKSPYFSIDIHHVPRILKLANVIIAEESILVIGVE